MRTTNRRRRGALRGALYGALACCFLSLAWGQFGNTGIIRSFKFPEFYESASSQTNRALKTLITGDEAQPNAAGIIAVKEMRIQTYEESGSTNVIARAPQCHVDLSRRLVWSTGRLEITSANGQFLTEGNEGFFCEMTNAVLILSNRVRTVINRQLLVERTNEKTN